LEAICNSQTVKSKFISFRVSTIISPSLNGRVVDQLVAMNSVNVRDGDGQMVLCERPRKGNYD
jgi:hypothetical protein